MTEFHWLPQWDFCSKFQTWRMPVPLLYQEAVCFSSTSPILDGDHLWTVGWTDPNPTWRTKKTRFQFITHQSTKWQRQCSLDASNRTLKHHQTCTTRQRSLILHLHQPWVSSSQFAQSWTVFWSNMTSKLHPSSDRKKRKSNKKLFTRRSSSLPQCGHTEAVWAVVKMITKFWTSSQAFSDHSPKSSTQKAVSSTITTGVLKKTSGLHGQAKSPTTNTLTNPFTTRFLCLPFIPLVSDTCSISTSRENTQCFS